MSRVPTIPHQSVPFCAPGGDSAEGENREENNSGFHYEDMLTPCAKIQKYAQSEIMYNRWVSFVFIIFCGPDLATVALGRIAHP